MKILVLEPYFGGSHKAFLQGLVAHLPFEFEFLVLPARKWKWRMRFSAPYFAELLKDMEPPDRILCSTFVDVAVLKGLAPAWIRDVPVATYFHENQFVYPVQVDDERDFHFAVTNLTTALASDSLAFNSRYNLDSFLAGCREIVNKIPDMPELRWIDDEKKILAKSVILHPGHDFTEIDAAPEPAPNKVPVIVWNHRWEYDKNPELFFNALFELKGQGIDFRLIVLGQSFKWQPVIFAEAEKILAEQIIHFGYAKVRADYFQFLKQGDIVVSTANHEFYGIAVLEAVRAGCCPLLPKRLSYPELLPSEYLYEDHEFSARLKKLLAHPARLDNDKRLSLTRKFAWSELVEQYRSWLVCDT